FGSRPTPGWAARDWSAGFGGGKTVVVCHVAPPSVDPYARIVPSERLFEPARSVWSWSGSIVIAVSAWGPGRFETSTFGAEEGAASKSSTASRRSVIAPPLPTPRRDRARLRPRAGAARAPSAPPARPQ